MDASHQKLLPRHPLRIDTLQPADRLNEPSAQVLILEKEYLELKSSVGYWRAMHAKAIIREKILQQTIKEQEGQIRDLRHRIFGKKSEKPSAKEKKGKQKDPKPNRPRGQQPGSKGHGLTERPDLPVKEEKVIFVETPICPVCGKPYISDEDGEKESIRYEVNVKAHVRIYKRQSMKKGCCCKGAPDKLLAPISANVIPRSPYGISIWEAILLTKFHYCQPTNRLIIKLVIVGGYGSAVLYPLSISRLHRAVVPTFNPICFPKPGDEYVQGSSSLWTVLKRDASLVVFVFKFIKSTFPFQPNIFISPIVSNYH